MVNVVLAEDHTIVRAGFRAILEAADEFQVVGETGSGDEVIPLVEQYRPEILLLDLSLPGKSGLEILPLVRHGWPGTHVVILSMHDADAYVVEAFRHGASGYVLKSAGVGMLKGALRQVLNGHRFVSPPLELDVIEQRLQDTSPGGQLAADNLSAREREVLALTVQGLSAKQIADRLFISPRTVEKHRDNLMRKLQVNGVAELVRLATEHRLLLLGPDEP